MSKRLNVMIGTSPQGQGGIAAVIGGYDRAGVLSRHHIHFITSHHSAFSGLLPMLWCFIRAGLSLLWLGLTRKPGWAHVHLASKGSYWRKRYLVALARKLGFDIIIHLHGGGFERFYYRQPEGRQRRIARFFASADKVLVLSRQSREWLAGICGRNDHIQVLYNCTPHVATEPACKQPRSLLFLGDISPAKGIFDLIAVIAQLAPVFPDLRLRIGGKGDSAALMALISDHKLQDQVEYLGWVSGAQKTALLRESQIFCLPSYYEAMPISVLEAMSASMAIVASDVGGIGEMLVDQQQALLIKPGDQQQLYASLNHLLNDTELTSQLAKAAYHRYQQAFAPERIAAQLSAIYQSLEQET